MILKILPMIFYYDFQNTKPRNHMIEEKLSSNFISVIECRHHFFPLGKVVNNNNNIAMPSRRMRVTCHKVDTPFPKWANDKNECNEVGRAQIL